MANISDPLFPSGPLFSQANAQSLGGAVSDIFSGFADATKIQGLQAEQQQYEMAATEAEQQAHYVGVSTAIQEAQANREMFMSMGRTRAEVAGAGFASSGSALDILRSSASQGALQSAALGQQGLIQQQSLEEQAASYTTMANAVGAAEKGSELSEIDSFVGAGISAVPFAGSAISTLAKMFS
jgi:hypothetical protein